MKKSSNLNISFAFYLNSGVTEFVWKKATIYVSEQLRFYRKPPRSRVETARANPAKDDAQEGCAMQLNGITLSLSTLTLGQTDSTSSNITFLYERLMAIKLFYDRWNPDIPPNHSTGVLKRV